MRSAGTDPTSARRTGLRWTGSRKISRGSTGTFARTAISEMLRLKGWIWPGAGLRVLAFARRDVGGEGDGQRDPQVVPFGEVHAHRGQVDHDAQFIHASDAVAAEVGEDRPDVTAHDRQTVMAAPRRAGLRDHGKR